MPYRYDYREEHRGLAFFLAVAMHALLAAFLLVSVQWQTRQPETVSVELWGGPPPPLEQPEPEVVPPQTVKQPEPEPLPEEKPDIATEKVKPRPTSKPTDKPTPVPTVAPKAATPSPAPAKKAAKEECDLTCILQKGMDKRVNAQPGEGKAGGKEGGVAGGTGSTIGGTGVGAGGMGSLDDYRSRLIALFKSRLVYPDDKPGNPQATLRISVLPDGSIREVKVLKASSDPAYDDAAVRAVRAVDRLPDPGRGRSFRDPELREFNVNFKLREK